MSSGLALEAEGGRWKRYPAYRDSGVEWLGEVPQGWDVLRLKNVTHFGYGNSLAADDRVPGDYYVYGSNGIVGRHEQPNTEGPCLIIGRKGSFGKVTYSKKSCFVIDTAYFVDSTLTNNNLRWLYYCLQWLQLDSFTKDSAVPGLAREDAYENLVPLCSVDEQRAIAAFLDRETGRIDALIAKKERLADLLEEKRAALISHAVTRGLDPDAPMKDSGVEWLGEVPEGWEVSKLGAKCIVKARLGWKGLKASEYVEEGYIFLSTPNIKNRNINFVNVNYITADRYFESPEIMLEAGDVLIAKDGSTLGITNVVRSLPAPSTVNSSIAVIRPKQSCDSVFLCYFLTSNYIQSFIQRMKGGMGVPHLFQADLRKFVVIIPPLPEQRAIAAFLDHETAKIDALTKKIYEQIEKLKEYRTALISAAVTGKIDVREVTA